MPQDGLPRFNFNVEAWDAAGQTYETLAICRTLALACVAFEGCTHQRGGPTLGPPHVNQPYR